MVHFGRVLDVFLEAISQELIWYSGMSLPLGCRLPEDLAILLLLPVELLTTLEIPVLAFQQTNVYDKHRARCTGARLFWNQASWNDCVWIQVGGRQTYSAPRGGLPAKPLPLFKIRKTYQDTICCLVGVQLMSGVNSRCQVDVHGLVPITVFLWGMRLKR